MKRRTLLIALTFAAVATALGYGLLGLAAPAGVAADATTTDVDALVAALASGGGARVVVLDETAPARASTTKREDDHDDDHDDDRRHQDRDQDD